MQDAVKELPISRDNGYLAEIQEENRQLSREVDLLRVAAAQLQAITDSRGFRLLQALYAVRLFFIPRLSFREHAAAQANRAFRAAAHWTRDCGNSLARKRRDSGETVGQKRPLSLGFAAPEGSLDVVRGRKESLYAPLNWRLNEDTRSDPGFIKLIILSAVHRSGSTLLQRICNARMGTLIWGEHGGLLTHFAEIYASPAFFSAAASQERIQYFSSGENPNLWIGSICPQMDFIRQATVESARTFLNTMYGQYRENHDIIGFKEVSYTRREYELLRRCYPEAEILFLVRNPLNTWNSTPRTWYPSLDAWIEKWLRNTHYFMAMANTDAHCRLLRHEDVAGQEKETMAILAETAKVSPKQIALVLGNKIGSAHVGINEAERQTILRQCGKIMANLGYV
jgi:hypothetical protein